MQDKSCNVQQRSYLFSLDIIKLCNNFPEKRIFWIIGDQLLRAGTSIGANLVEAKAASSKKDFIKFYQIALKSANETKYWLYLLKDSRIYNINIDKIENLLEELDQICKILDKSLLTMKGKS